MSFNHCTFFSDAHKEAVNKIISVSDNLIATGDDGGVVKLWDIRVGGSEVKNWDWHDDFVSGLSYNSDQNTLLSIGGSTLSIKILSTTLSSGCIVRGCYSMCIRLAHKQQAIQ